MNGDDAERRELQRAGRRSLRAARRSYSACGVVALSFAVGEVWSQTKPPPATLAVRRSPDVVDCPDAFRLAARVDRQLRRAALTPEVRGEPPTFDVEFTRTGSGFGARMTSGGATRRTRDLSDTSATCEGLSEAVTITLALLLSEGASRPEDSPASASASAPAAPPTSPVSGSASASAPPAPPAPPAPFRAATVARPRVNAGAEVFGGAAFGVVGEPAAATWGGATARLERLSFGAGAAWVAGPTFDVTRGRARADLVAAYARACLVVVQASALDAELCVTPSVGSLTAAGNGFASDYRAHEGWVAVGAGARAGGPALGALRWVLTGDAVFPLRSDRFSVARLGDVYQPARVGALVGAGLGVTIW